MGLGIPYRMMIKPKRKRETKRPTVKKLAKMKSLSEPRLRDFLGSFDLGFEDGRML